jgi:hypothetical protein
MARWLLQLRDRVPGDFLPVTQEGLAQLLGVRRTTVTLTMSKLRAAGAIPSDRRGFVEIDRARLDCPRRNLALRRSGKAPSSSLTKRLVNPKPFRERQV